MYSLLISADPEYWNLPRPQVDKSRFLTATENAIRSRFIDSESGLLRYRDLESIPALLGPESGQGGHFRLAKLASVQDVGKGVAFTPRLDEHCTPVPAEFVEHNMHLFGVDHKFALHHSNWSVKGVDLRGVLRASGFYDGPEAIDQPEIPRALMLDAARFLQVLAHADLDQFLLELDITGLEAGRDKGSRQDRATAIAKFAADQPLLLAASGLPLNVELVKRAIEIDTGGLAGSQEVSETVRNRFWDILTKSGLDRILGAVRDAKPEAVRRPWHGASKEPSPSSIFADLSGAAGAAGELPYFVTGAATPAAPPSPPRVSQLALQAAAPRPDKPRIFVVHGRDDAMKHDVTLFLTRIGLDPVILHEQPNEGQTLISKFIKAAETCQYAVVLSSAEDFGALVGEQPKPRARQNVVFELGFFIGKFGPSKVAALVKGGPEEPSDFKGVVYISYQGNWKVELAREFEAANIPYDARAAIRS